MFNFIQINKVALLKILKKITIDAQYICQPMEWDTDSTLI